MRTKGKIRTVESPEAAGGSADKPMTVELPRLRAVSPIYLGILFVLALGFYGILLVGMAASALAIYFITTWSITAFLHLRSITAIEALFGIYAAIFFFAWSILRGLVVKVGGVPFGIKLNRIDHTELFLVTDKVAKHVDADPILQIYLTPDNSIGVWEETALYLPPGFGTRKLVIGMGALCYLTLDQLLSVLAHEYGHFSNKDTYFSTFVYRVSAGYERIMRELRSRKSQYLNPFVWVLSGYVWLYRRVEASFSRQKEYRADRFSIEALGLSRFKDALLNSSIEGAFYHAVAMPQLIRQAASVSGFANIFRFVGILRKRTEHDKPEVAWDIASQLLALKTAAGDSHPCLKERLAAQGVTVSMADLSVAPRVPESPVFDAKARMDELRMIRSGPQSAAEWLFHTNLHDIQVELSQMATAYWRFILRAHAAAQQME